MFTGQQEKKHTVFKVTSISDLKPGDECRIDPSTIPDPSVLKPGENDWIEVSKKSYFVGDLSNYQFRRPTE